MLAEHVCTFRKEKGVLIVLGAVRIFCNTGECKISKTYSHPHSPFSLAVFDLVGVIRIWQNDSFTNGNDSTGGLN